MRGLTRVGSIAGLAALLLGGILSVWGPPRLTWLNSGLRVEYPWPRAAGALLATAGAGLLAVGARRRAPRILLAILAAAALAFALERLVYRLEAGEPGLVRRGLLGSTTVAWREVAHVASAPDAVVVVTTSGERIVLATSDWDPQGVAQLERTMARRVRESR